MKVFWFIYNVLLPVGLVLVAPTYLLRMRKRGQASYRWKERFGIFDSAVQQGLKDACRPVWIHAVSVGEVKIAAVLIREIRNRRPDQDIILSTTTITGRRLAEALEDNHLSVIYHTVDLWHCVERVFDLIEPALVLLVEQELWPNQLMSSKRRGIPVWVVNARLSDRSRKRFRKFRTILRPFLATLDFIGVQSEQEIGRFSDCGFPPHKLFNIGSMKFDVVPERDESKQEELLQLKRGLGWLPEDLVILGGSTHASEEEMLLRVCSKVKLASGALRLILVPRHAERTSELALLCERMGKSFRLRSSLEQGLETEIPEVLIVDTTGELAELYGTADINIIGKSFFGVGGQNFLEAARFPHPIVVGPEMSNFKDTVALFNSEHALIQVQDEHELLQALNNLVSNKPQRIEIGLRAGEVMARCCGAAGKQAEMISDFLATDEPL
jgi:3-deoxy-D-manno-octulosonic-acid transferase